MPSLAAGGFGSVRKPPQSPSRVRPRLLTLRALANPARCPLLRREPLAPVLHLLRARGACAFRRPYVPSTPLRLLAHLAPRSRSRSRSVGRSKSRSRSRDSARNAAVGVTSSAGPAFHTSVPPHVPRWFPRGTLSPPALRTRERHRRRATPHGACAYSRCAQTIKRRHSVAHNLPLTGHLHPGPVVSQYQQKF